MKRSSQVVAILGLMVFSGFFAANVSAQTGPVAGVYENITVGKESGDLVGMRVMIIPAGGGFHAMVQIAQGGAEDPKPEFVAVTVNRATVQFTVGEEKFNGTITVNGLRLRNSAGETQVLKRRPCATLFR